MNTLPMVIPQEPPKMECVWEFWHNLGGGAWEHWYRFKDGTETPRSVPMMFPYKLLGWADRKESP